MKKLIALLMIVSAAFALFSGVSLAEEKAALLIVSTGTARAESRENALGAIEKSLAANYPDREVRRALMSETIRTLIEEQEGVRYDGFTEAMRRLVADGVTDVVILPTFVMDGSYQESLVQQAAAFEPLFDRFRIGKPLLSDAADEEALTDALIEISRPYLEENTAAVWMGHGTEHAANEVYQRLQQRLLARAENSILIGTVEAEPTLDDVLRAAKDMKAEKVVLLPLMVTAGTHAYEDMAGEEEDSWKSAFEAEGFTVECVLKGLGEYASVRKIYAAHAEEALQDAAPMTAERLAEGVYPIDVTCASEHFKVTSARLIVRDGGMRARITLSGTAYTRFFVGTAAEAAAAPEERILAFTQDETGAYQFEFPVSALDTEIPCAAWSKNKETWYDRTLVFVSASMPTTAFLQP